MAFLLNPEWTECSLFMVLLQGAGQTAFSATALTIADRSL